MLRPHQSLELDEIVQKLNRTWGCKLDLVDFAPPGPRQAAGYPPSTYERGARVGCRACGGALADIETRGFRPHQSLDLVEVCNMFACTGV